MNALLLAMLVVSTPLRADDLATEVRALVAESQKAKPASEASSAEIAALLKDTKSGEPLKDRASAIKLLEAAKRIPPTSKAYREGLAKIAQARWRDERIADEVGKASSDLYGTDVMRVLDAYRTLIASVHPLHLSAKQVARATLTRIREELAGQSATLIETLIYGALLRQLVDDHLITVSDPIYVELMHLEEQEEAARHALRSTLHKDKSANPIDLELELTSPLTFKLTWLSKRLLQQVDSAK